MQIVIGLNGALSFADGVFAGGAFDEIMSKPLTKAALCGKIISANAGMAELVDARDLKSREA